MIVGCNCSAKCKYIFGPYAMGSLLNKACVCTFTYKHQPISIAVRDFIKDVWEELLEWLL